MVLPFLILFTITLVVAFSLPPVYISTSKILIEKQEIPSELVRSTITGYANEQIETVRQRVMTSTNLTKIIEDFDLYAKQRRSEPIEEVLGTMRDSVRIEMDSADVIDPRSGKSITATIAFTLSFEDEDPELSQKVVNELTSLFLDENLKTRTRMAKETTDFLAEEAARLDKKITDLEQILAVFKEENLNQLPELLQLNQQFMQRTEDDIRATQRQIQTLEERKIYMQSELVQLDPNVDLLSASGQRIMPPANRLKALEAQYISVSAIYSPDHPDMIKMKKEIANLRKVVGDTDNVDEIKIQLVKLRADLAEKTETYSADHPDVRNLERAIASLQKRLDAALAKQAGDASAPKPDNPAYISIQAQIKASDSEIRQLRRELKELKEKLQEYETRLIQSPEVERKYRALTRDYDNALDKYREIKDKQMQAKLAETLEIGSKGDRFSLIEPPTLPEKPYKPNRIAIILLGLVLSLGGGLGTVAVRESLDHSIRGVKRITALLGSAPLAVIPYIMEEKEAHNKIIKRRLQYASIAGGVVVMLILVHMLLMPLDVLWFVTLRRLGI